MPAVKKTTSKNKTVTSTSIISAYMEYVLDQGVHPHTVYKFCKEIKITETNFYDHFGSFDNLKMSIWSTFHLNTINVLEASKEFAAYSNKEKMLSYFFTLFELLTANRSYVLYSIDEHKNMLQNLKQLKGLRIHQKEFTKHLIEVSNEEKKYKITKNPTNLFSEGAWIQFLFLLKYWMNDNSASFEKTDIAIEKSVKVIFDVFETTPLESIIDFGKFIFKEKFAPNI